MKKMKARDRLTKDSSVLDEISVELPDTIEPGLTLEDITYLDDIKKRELWLNGEIDDALSTAIIKQIFNYNREDYQKSKEARQPIKLFINSPGGYVLPGLNIIDAIRLSRTPVWIINLGRAYSMAFHIAINGDKRFSLPTASYLIHDGAEGGYDSSSKFRDRLEFNDKLELETRKNLLENTQITEDLYDSNYRKEWYVLPDEALKLGILDCVLEDFDMIID